MAYTNYPQETKDKAVEMYIDGKTAKEVSDAIGCSLDSVLLWTKKAGFDTRWRGNSRKVQEDPIMPTVSCSPDKQQINPLLLSLAGENDLTPYIGKEITKMQPREIFKFLELLNIQGKLTLKQTITLK